MKTVAYARVSTGERELRNQKPAILEFAQKEGIQIDEFVGTTISTGRYRSMDKKKTG